MEHTEYDLELMDSSVREFSDGFVHKKISQVAGRIPREIAVSYESGTLTFGELEKLSNQLAVYLIGKGVRPETKVAIYLEHGLSLAVVILGILKAGGAYIYLSPQIPLNRIKVISDDSKALLLITDHQLSARVRSAGPEVIEYNSNDWNSEPGGDHCPEPQLRPHHAAYVLYTSGSTGKPKGVIIEHRNLDYYLDWTTWEFANKLHVKFPLTSSMSFAAGVTQFYSALLKGYTLHILPADLIRQPEKLLQWYSSHPGYALYCVPTLWNEIVSAKEYLNDGLIGPSCIILSGEAVSEKLIARTFEFFPSIKAWNLYGPTEAVANLSAGMLLPGKPVTIGDPITGTELYIVKENGMEALPGETGELLASGPGIARGYMGREDITAERFVRFRSVKNGEVRAYRTGDLVKLLEDGKMVYVGRNDQQVKINGFRIELMEVELALKQLEAVQDAVVKAFQTESEAVMVAYVIQNRKLRQSVQTLRQELTAVLPVYMIPSRWVFLDQFPLLANGKANRGKLPYPGNPRPDLGYEVQYPETEEQQKMVAIFEKVLGYSGLGISDHFFDLGGTSLKVNYIIHEIGSKFGVQLPFRAVFTHPTPESLLNNLATAGKKIELQTRVARKSSDGEFYPLASSQASLWYLDQANKHSTAYNIPYMVTMRGQVQFPALKESIQRIINRHLTLRSSVAIVNGLPFFHVRKFVKVDLQFEDYSFMGSAAALKGATEAVELSSMRPFDLLAAPLFRFHLFKTGVDDYIIGVVFHHIIFDGWSINNFHKELIANYAALSTGSEPDEAALKLTYLDYLADNEYFSLTGEFQQSRNFWRKHLAHFSNQFILPHDFGPSQDRHEPGGRIEFNLSAGLKNQLQVLNRQCGVTPFISLMGAFLVVVSKYNNQGDMVIATPVANRSRQEYYDLIGYFTNVILIRSTLSEAMTFAGLLVQLKNTCVENFEYERLPYSEQIRILFEQGCSVQPSGVELLFAYHEAFGQSNSNSLSTGISELFNRNAKFPVFMECQDAGDQIKVCITYDKNLYQDQTMVQLLAHYHYTLNFIAQNPGAGIAGFDLNTREANFRFQESFNGAVKYKDETLLLHKLFESATDKYGDQIAIRQNDNNYTYRQIEQGANVLSRHMLEKGVDAGEPVGIFMDHSATMISAILAVLKIGAHYVPLDPDYPAKRTQYVMEHSRLRVILTESSQWDKLPEPLEIVINADNYLSGEHLLDADRPDCATVTQGDLVYIMYTSGSTGNPKGVMVPHKGVCNYLLWMKEEFGVTTNDRIIGKTSISFDVSVWELFLPLISGASLVLYNRVLMKAPDQLAEVINKEKVNIVQFVPSGLKAFVDAGVLKNCGTLLKIFCGGEKMPVNLKNEVFKQFTGELHNLYGPTEASIFSCHFECRRTDKHVSVPIGKPIPNCSVYILDEQLNPLPPGRIGDVYIYGDILATGYLFNDVQTRSAFIPYECNGEKFIIYKTGDRGKYLADGNIEFHGRTDHQVKVRGYRIELGEIEQVLLRFPGVGKAEIMRKEVNENDVRLLAFLIPDRDAIVNEQEVRQFARQHLPEYMLPSVYYIVDHFPTLPNGKINYALMESSALLSHQEHKNIDTFRDDVEKILVEIWTHVLGRNNFKLTDNFMDAGGHSILFAKVCALINQQLQQNYSIIDLFQYPSIESFAKHYREKFLNSPMGNSFMQDRIAKRKNKLNELKKRNN